MTRSVCVLLLAAGTALTAGAQARLDGAAAPDFALKTLAGENLRLSEFLGEVVMLNFWATWCGSCRQQMPRLDRLYTTYKSTGFVLLGVNLDDDNGRKAAEFARTLNVTYPVLLDPRKAVAPLYRPDALPMTVLIDRAGVVRHVYYDYKQSIEEQYLAELRALLNE